MTEFNDAEKSRSQKKRESTALQRAGEALAALSPGQRASLALPLDLSEALAEWQAVKTHEAKRRQMQYIGRLMRELDDVESLLTRLEDLQNNRQRRNQAENYLEALRLRLLSAEESDRDAALAEALSRLPGLSRARLIHVMDAALAEREKKRPPRHFRELFRMLREAGDEKQGEGDEAL